MTASSPLPAPEPKFHAAPRLKPFAVRRHDMWASASPAAATRRPATVTPFTAAAGSSAGRASPWWRPLVRIAGWPFRMIATAWRIQGEIRDLNVLDDHLLRDMGVTRSELRAAVRKGERGQPDRPAEPGSYEHP